MEEVGVLQETLAEAVGCSQGAISRILAGQTRNSRFLPRIAEYLGVPLPWLLGTSDEMRASTAAESLGPDERELLNLFREFSSEERVALITIARSMSGGRPPPPTLHSSGPTYRGEHS